jgi:trehalose-6-phosphate synthase
MIEYYKGSIYPDSIPEFRHLQKADGTIEMQVRYINSAMGYTGKWMPVNTVQEKQEAKND